jgi:O-antigen/teichoic acid export membrane protein
MLKKRLALNLGANVFGQFANFIVQIASVPLFLSFWSKERYGVWILISSIPAYLSLGEAGFATSSANEVSMAFADGNCERGSRALHTAWGFLTGISVILLALTIVAFGVIPWNTWLRSSSVPGGEVRWTIFLLGLYSIAGILIAIFETIYRAAYRYARHVFLSNGARLLELGAVVTAVALRSSMVTLAGLMLAVRLVAFAVFYLDSRGFSEYLSLGFTGFSVAELKRSWRPSAMFMAVTVGNAFYFQGLTLLVGASLGSAEVVVFNSTRTLSRVIVAFVTLIKHSVWPEFSYLFGAGDLRRARHLNELAFETSWIVSLGLAVSIFIAAPWIMPVWTHHAVQLDLLLLAIFLISALLNGVWWVTSGFLMGTNQHEGLTVRYLIAAALTVIIAALSVRRFGVYGVATAMVVCELVLLPYAISRTCQLLNQSVRDLLRASFQLRAIRQAAATYRNRPLVQSE